MGIEKLVVVGRGRKRNQQRRQAHGGNFGKGGRAGTADGHGRSAKRQFHFGKERFDDGFQFCVR